jgi:hypothetical protein
MSETSSTPEVERSGSEGPQSALEKNLIQEYLQVKGYSLESLHLLPKDEAQRLMREACTYASLKLAEVESRARFREEIHGPY